MTKNQKLSVIITSRNDVDRLIGLIDNVYTMADQIVVIDASCGEEARRLERLKNDLKKKKTTIFKMVATSYSEPARQYGLIKCTNNWVLLLDTDERPNEQLHEDIGDIINAATCEAFYVRRYEYLTSTKEPSYIGWQCRLHKKDATYFSGEPHVQPLVSGKIGVLDKKYYIEHFTVTMKSEQEIAKALQGGYKIESYLRRLTYRRVADMASRNKLLHILSKTYFFMKGRLNSELELSRFDYNTVFFINSLTWIPETLSNLGLRDYIKLFFINRDYERGKLDYFFKLPENESRLRLAISQDVCSSGGLTKYLGLDDLRKIRMWNSKYSSIKNERSVLYDMLVAEYTRRQAKAQSREKREGL
jgi:hypothetical protein